MKAAGMAISLGMVVGAGALAIALWQLPKGVLSPAPAPGAASGAEPVLVAPPTGAAAPAGGSGDGTGAPGASSGAPGASGASGASAVPASGRGIAALADPAWVGMVSQRAGIPARPLAAYAGAALQVHRERGCAVGWHNLAAIGLVETAHGTFGGSTLDAAGVARPAIIGVALDGNGVGRIPDTDRGVLDGDTTWDRAVGPMQFIPDSWQRWAADGNGDGTTDPQQIDDAALAAARYLCDASGGLTDREAWLRAIASYNRSDDYRDRVAQAAAGYAAAAAG